MPIRRLNMARSKDVAGALHAKRRGGTGLDPSRPRLHMDEGTSKENATFFEIVVDKRPNPFYARIHALNAARTADGEEKIQKIFPHPLARGGVI